MELLPAGRVIKPMNEEHKAAIAAGRAAGRKRRERMKELEARLDALAAERDEAIENNGGKTHGIKPFLQAVEMVCDSVCDKLKAYD